MRKIINLALMLIIAGNALAAESPTIMVSIKPFYNLCAKVMHSVGTPILLLHSNASPHDYHLKPSDITKIKSSDLVIWGGPELEGYLAKPLANDSKQQLNLSELKNLHLLDLRTSINWQQHDHDHHHDHDHSHNSSDPHFWLNPENAIVITNAIAAKLSALDPEHAKIYQKNANEFSQQVRAQIKTWQNKLAVTQNKPYIVFHDAYQYFDKYFKLNGVGAISLHPEIPPSAKRIQQIQDLLTAQKVNCIFGEPQFNYKIVETLSNGLNIYHGELDPLGQDADLGANGYILLLDKLVNNFTACGKFSLGND